MDMHILFHCTKNGCFSYHPERRKGEGSQQVDCEVGYARDRL